MSFRELVVQHPHRKTEKHRSKEGKIKTFTQTNMLMEEIKSSKPVKHYEIKYSCYNYQNHYELID